MVNSKVTKGPDHYPRLMIHPNSKKIILASSVGTGVVVNVGDGKSSYLRHEIGEYRNDWGGFETFTGEITLSNK